MSTTASTLLEVGLLCHVLHVFDSLVHRHDVGECEERGLKNGVRYCLPIPISVALVDSVDGIELDVVVSDVVLNCVRGDALQVPPESHWQLSMNMPPGLTSSDDLVALQNVGRVVASNEVSLSDVVRSS